MQCTTLPGLSSLKGWWGDRCLFFDDWKYHKLLSLTRERVSPRVSLLYSAKCSAVCPLLKGFLGLGNALANNRTERLEASSRIYRMPVSSFSMDENCFI